MTPAELRASIAADCTPVRRLPSPFVRALWVMPFAVLALFAAPAYFNVRADADRLGWPITWGLSMAQLAVGLAVVVAALRESIPGRAWPAPHLVLWITAPVSFVIATTYVSYGMSPVALDRGWWVVGLMCLGGSAATALPAVALGSVLAARAYPTRPAIMGVLFGLGGGVMADAGWRMFCHFSEPTHVLSAHLGGIVVAVIAGAALALTLRTPFR